MRIQKGDSGNTAPAIFDSANYLFRRCHQIAVAIFLDECGDGDLTLPQFMTLAALEKHGPLDQVTLGGIAALDRTTVAVVIGNLAKRGLVTSEKSKVDRRAKVAALTDEGVDALSRAQPAAVRAQARVLASLSEEEQQTLSSLLARISDDHKDVGRPSRRGSG